MFKTSESDVTSPWGEWIYMVYAFYMFDYCSPSWKSIVRIQKVSPNEPNELYWLLTCSLNEVGGQAIFNFFGIVQCHLTWDRLLKFIHCHMQLMNWNGARNCTIMWFVQWHCPFNYFSHLYHKDISNTWLRRKRLVFCDPKTKFQRMYSCYGTHFKAFINLMSRDFQQLNRTKDVFRLTGNCLVL